MSQAESAPLPPRDYQARRSGAPELSIEFQQRAFVAIAGRPEYTDARRFVYCEPMVMLESIDWLERTRFADTVKSAVRRALSDANRVLIVSLWTSEQLPQPLEGFGKTFNFLLHPQSLEVLRFDQGTWRA